ncbi:hypothetical protein QYF36_001677 [Acer negundo]|nr:hypothetical protein QYF36_001677 [Acer negundo]
MIEAVGHEFIEEFFGCCELLLAEDGLLVLQFTSVPDQHYNEHRLSPGFIKEYIFPGGCLPSLNRITIAMTSASRLCVEHMENIGIHYHQALRCWRKTFLENKSEVLALGFNQKFIRMWEYYLDYCAAGFKSRTLGNYQNSCSLAFVEQSGVLQVVRSRTLQLHLGPGRQSLLSSFFQYLWASGFSAAFLKKNSIAARGVLNANEVDTNALVDNKAIGEPKPAVTKLCDSLSV